MIFDHKEALPKCDICGASCILYTLTAPGEGVPGLRVWLGFSCGQRWQGFLRHDYKKSFPDGQWSNYGLSSCELKEKAPCDNASQMIRNQREVRKCKDS